MLGIEVRFPHRRYHATPWDAHANEGRVEWPPSPWRLLRALVSCWHLRACDVVSREALQAVVHALASKLPEYRLPGAIAAHTRHYMPVSVREPGKTTKVLDTFLHLAHPCVEILWPELDVGGDTREALGVLLERLGYLGRAESWVEARLVEQPPPSEQPTVFRAVPREVEVKLAGCDLVRLLAMLPPESFRPWRDGVLEGRRRAVLERKRRKAEAMGRDPNKVRLTRREQEKVVEAANLPVDLVAAIEVDSEPLRKAGWSQPPGTRWVAYTLASKAVATYVPPPAVRALAARPTVARYALASSVLPTLRQTMTLGDRVHRSLVKLSGDPPAAVFTGTDAHGRPREGHQHAFYLPEVNGEGRIAHVTVYAPMGFDPRAQRALDQLRRVWGFGGHDVRLVLTHVGDKLEEHVTSLFAESRVFRSLTPFVPTRHPKRRKNGAPKVDAHGLWIGSPEHDLRRLLREAGLPAPRAVEPTGHSPAGGRLLRWLSFPTTRRGGGRRSRPHGMGFRIEFGEQVRGPLALGYGAHFGLGLFVPH